VLRVTGLPLFLPAWSLPIYFNLNKDEKTEKPRKTAEDREAKEIAGVGRHPRMHKSRN
jgi:hypothetical protein